ncbi:MAG: ParA family protein [Chloroflexota bacterium]
MTYVITVSNEKGGVAKTTTTLSLGAVLAEAGHKVLVIDLDPQANLTLALGIEPGSAAVTSSHILIESASLNDARLTTEIENLDLVPSHVSIESAEQFLPVRSHYTLGIRRALEAAAPLAYDYVFLDCPPFLGAITINALSAADLLIIPTQAEYFSAYALRNMMALIRRVRQESNPGLGYRILITLLDRRNRTHRSIQEQLQNTFGEGMFRTVIEIDTKLRESPIAGLPITRYRPGARGALQYRELAQELTEYVKDKTQQAA